MRKATATTLTLVTAAVAIAAPTLAALYLARRQSKDAVTTLALSYARDTVHRTDATAVQIDAGIDEIVAGRKGDPCSDASIVPMRKVDVASSYIQAIGYVVGDHYVCTSLGPALNGLPLGHPDVVTPRGVKVRTNVALPFAGTQRFIVVERDQYAAIVHKALLIDVSTQQSDVALASFLMPDHVIMAQHGTIKPAWLERLRPDTEVTFTDDDYLVALVPSSAHYVAAVAALPMVYLDQRLRSTALLLVPIGLVAGGLLAFAVFYLAPLPLGLPAVIKTGLRRGEFFVVYEPIVDLTTGRWVGAEALLRWRRPDGEMVRPDLFIPAAEDTGLIEQVTERVIELVLPDALRLFRHAPNFTLSLNLSAADVYSPQTVSRLAALARATGARAGNLLVEVTERGLVVPDRARAVIHDLRANDVSIAIDDFGTGFSSLSSLQSLELDYLKIDKSFVSSIGAEAPTSHVVTHIIAMGQALNLRLIAEGVETPAQAQFLRQRGVQFAQGWLFSRALSATDLLRALPQTDTRRVGARSVADASARG